MKYSLRSLADLRVCFAGNLLFSNPKEILGRRAKRNQLFSSHSLPAKAISEAMKYSLQSLMIVVLLAPAVLAILYWFFVEIPSLKRETRGLPNLEELSSPPPNSPP